MCTIVYDHLIKITNDFKRIKLITLKKKRPFTSPYRAVGQNHKSSIPNHEKHIICTFLKRANNKNA